ncbi:MAG: YwaF family protein [Clostridia bacterium]|nr:YwaF family protein [Clostridia bacterium]
MKSWFYIDWFNFWYFFFLAISAGLIVGLYFLLRNKSQKTQKIVLFAILAFGLLMHFMKVLYPPYSTDPARMLRDSWFVNICGANIALFPILFWVKNKLAKDYMVYIGIISGFIALVYPQEPMAKNASDAEIIAEGLADKYAPQMEQWMDILRFYFHHWMLIAIPLLMVLLGLHKLSYKRIFNAPTGLLLVMLFIMLNQLFQAELGYIPLRDANFFDVNWKNTSYIWGPDGDAIGEFLAIFTPKFFTIVPEGVHAGEVKYWPWFWLIFPCYILVSILAFGVTMIWDHKAFATDVKAIPQKSKELLAKKKASKLYCRVFKKSANTDTPATEEADEAEAKAQETIETK